MNKTDLFLPASLQAPSLDVAFAILGLKGLARTCCVTVQAVHRWKRRGLLPRTELTGETHYSELISVEMARLGRGILKVTEKELLKEARRGWREVRMATRVRAKERTQAQAQVQTGPDSQRTSRSRSRSRSRNTQSKGTSFL